MTWLCLTFFRKKSSQMTFGTSLGLLSCHKVFKSYEKLLFCSSGRESRIFLLEFFLKSGLEIFCFEFLIQYYHSSFDIKKIWFFHKNPIFFYCVRTWKFCGKTTLLEIYFGKIFCGGTALPTDMYSWLVLGYGFLLFFQKGVFSVMHSFKVDSP